MAIPKHPMKAPNEIVPFDYEHIRYPQYASTKYDGFRCINLCGERLLSPACKDIPNANLTRHFSAFLTYCQANRIVTDGELYSPALDFSALSSIIRSYDKNIPAHVKYYIFDFIPEADWDGNRTKPFMQRYQAYLNLPAFPGIECVTQNLIHGPIEARETFERAIANSEEGIMMRDVHAPYIESRGTKKNSRIWKFKQFVTHDAVIIGMEEQMKLREGVARTTNELGYLEREHSQELYEPAGTCGSLWVEWQGARFKVKPGRGYNAAKKQELWYARDTLIGKHCEFKYMPHGTKDAPRIGSLVRLRPDLD